MNGFLGTARVVPRVLERVVKAHNIASELRKPRIAKLNKEINFQERMIGGYGGGYVVGDRFAVDMLDTPTAEAELLDLKLELAELQEKEGRIMGQWSKLLTAKREYDKHVKENTCHCCGHVNEK